MTKEKGSPSRNDCNDYNVHTMNLKDAARANFGFLGYAIAKRVAANAAIGISRLG
jgi:hypothetical protein